MDINYKDCSYTKFLSNIPPFYKEMTLDGIKALLHQLGDFHETLKVIHVAGTNGKGSSVKMLSSIYKHAGFKVGTFTSPYIVDYRECIHIDNQIIDKSLMNLATHKVSKAYQQLKDKSSPLPTHYECITVVSLLAMYLEKVDLAIVEVLMGGLNDATNIFSAPLITLITSISLDHTEYLGNTIELIAAQKAGIIKQNRPVILNKNIDAAYEVIKSIASNYSSPLYQSDDYVIEHYTTNDIVQYSSHLVLNGSHQLDNLKGVLATIHLLGSKFRVKTKHMIAGLESVNHPCRVEELSHEGLHFIIDGSHNEDGIKALISYIKENYPNIKPVFILGILKDKNLHMIRQHIYSIASEVILTQPISPRGFDIDEFYSQLSPSYQAITERIPQLENVYTHIMANKKQATNSLFIACGSLYIGYPFRQLLHV